MFKKAVEAKSHQRLSGADRKKLKRTLRDRFPRASDADIDALLPPKVSFIIYNEFIFFYKKIYLHRVIVYNCLFFIILYRRRLQCRSFRTESSFTVLKEGFLYFLTLMDGARIFSLQVCESSLVGI